ncbi:MAG: ABC transporter ATP-binding protein [Bacteroidia bacterium]|nr:ABC transporter ATP-binding protein [Bacteroidia bacterium]
MLVVDSISHSYTQKKHEAVRALDAVGFTATSGEITAVVGPNGSGKSTLFRVIASLLQATAGSVRFDGRPLNKADMSVVFQSPALDGLLTVFENFSHHMMLHGRRLERAALPRDVLDALDLDEVLDRRVDTLSGGYQRRVEVAKALLTGPRLLVLDEPFSGLDVRARMQFFAHLRDIAQQRALTVVLITHELDLAALCGHVVMLHKGSVMADAAPAKLLVEFGETVAEVRSADSVAVERRLKTAGYTVFGWSDDTLFVPHASLRGIVDALGDDAERCSIESRRPSLDDYFLTRTGAHIVERTEAIAA